MSLLQATTEAVKQQGGATTVEAAVHPSPVRALSTASTVTPPPLFSSGALSGRTAIVTGSTSGIGLGIARTLLSAGARVMLNGFGEAAAIEALQAELTTQFGEGSVAYSGADMADHEQIEKMVQETVEKMGSIDILINNAGVQHVSPVISFPKDAWERVLSINLSSAFHTTQSALPHLLRSPHGGRIINVASVHGSVASKGKAAYVASKHGLIGLSKVVALEHANDGVTCNVIAPGWVLTPLVQQQIEARAQESGRTVQQEKEALLGEKQPMLQFSTPEDLGALAVFLCSPAAKTITGTTFTMDGGWTAQ